MMGVSLCVLVVDDDANIRRTLRISLKDLGCQVEEAASVKQALEQLRGKAFDLVLTDMKMEGGSGLELLPQVKSLQRHCLTVLMTAFASYENAVEAVKEGAYDYLPKPFTTSQLEHLLARVLVVVELSRENEALRGQRGRDDHYFAGMTSAASQRLQDFVNKVAPSEATLLLVGESGTGKSELARAIHHISPRAAKPFITVHCTTLAESLLESELFGHMKGAFTGATQDKAGKLELADGGTLFLDEIGELSAAGQSKLLRFLQDKIFEPVGSNKEISVDTRVVAATNKNLQRAVQEGKFREDLYYRLNVFECQLVPLRERREDIPVLFLRFLRETKGSAGQDLQVPRELMERLSAYDWPGNIRELRNVAERLRMLSPRGKNVRAEDLPDSILKAPAIGAKPESQVLKSLAEVEREHIARVLKAEKNLEKAAEILGISSVTLWRKRKEYGF